MGHPISSDNGLISQNVLLSIEVIVFFKKSKTLVE